MLASVRKLKKKKTSFNLQPIRLECEEYGRRIRKINRRIRRIRQESQALFAVGRCSLLSPDHDGAVGAGREHGRLRW